MFVMASLYDLPVCRVPSPHGERERERQRQRQRQRQRELFVLNILTDDTSGLSTRNAYLY